MIQRPDLGFENFAPGSGLLSLEQVRELIACSRSGVTEAGEPHNVFYVAKVAPFAFTQATSERFESDEIGREIELYFGAAERQ